MTDAEKQKRIEILLAWGAAVGMALGSAFDLSLPKSVGDFIGAALLAAVLTISVLIPWKLTVQYSDAWRIRAGWLVVFAFSILGLALLGPIESRTGGREIFEKFYASSLLVNFLVSFLFYMKFLPENLAGRFRQGVENGLTALMVAFPFSMLMFLDILIPGGLGITEGEPKALLILMWLLLAFILLVLIVVCCFAVKRWRNRERPVGRNLAPWLFAFLFAPQILRLYRHKVEHPFLGLLIMLIAYTGTYVLYHAIIIQDEDLFEASSLWGIYKWPYRAIRRIFRPRAAA